MLILVAQTTPMNSISGIITAFRLRDLAAAIPAWIALLTTAQFPMIAFSQFTGLRNVKDTMGWGQLTLRVNRKSRSGGLTTRRHNPLNPVPTTPTDPLAISHRAAEEVKERSHFCP